MVVLSLSNVRAGFGQGQDEYVVLENGSGSFLLLDDGVAASVSGTLRSELPGFEFNGDFDLLVNNSGNSVNETFKSAGGDQQTLTVDQDTELILRGAEVGLVVAGHSLGGNFEVISAGDTLDVTVSDAALGIGSYLQATNGSGEFKIDGK